MLYANPPASPLVRDGRIRDAELQTAVDRAFARESAESIELDAGMASYALAVTPVPEEGYANVYGLDVTERRRVESELRRDESDIRALYRIASRPSLDLGARVRKLLTLMPQHFGPGVAVLSRLVPDVLEVVDVSAPNPRVSPGTVHVLEETISVEVVRRGDVVAISDLSRSGWSDHPAHRQLGLGSFIGAPIGIEGHIDGVLSFSSLEPMANPFRSSDVDFLRLMAGWIGGEMERDRITQELADANRDLREAAVRARELAIAADDANQAKGEFLAAMSHEIRTPLHGIIGSVDVLRGGPLDDQSRAIVDVLEASADDLMRIVDDVLDFSKIESRELVLELRAVDVRRLLDESARLYAASAETKGVDLEVLVEDDVPSQLLTDPTRLRQVAGNLVANGVKFTTEGGVLVHVEIRGRSDPQATTSPETLRLEVTDTGIGMDAATVARAFDLFSQADASTSRRYGGTGLGLAITRRLVELMGGSIHVTSHPGRGTTVTVDLPLNRATTVASTVDDTASLRPAAAPPAALRVGTLDDLSLPSGRSVEDGTVRGRVLVVDDDGAAARVAQMLLERHGMSVEVAMTGAEALDRLATSAPDLVLLDCRLPGMDGFEVARRQRQAEVQSARAPVPLIATTADV